MEKFNIAELLKDCPKGMELDCTMYDNARFEQVDEKAVYPIVINIGSANTISLTKEGHWNKFPNAKCVIFPKGKTTWEGFVPPYKFKDGDIVYIKTKGHHQNELIIIFKEIKNNYIHKYVCFAYQTLYTRKNALYSLVDIEIIRLATEEEKEKLFDAIKANGYKWDDETKILEKSFSYKIGTKVWIKSDKEHKYINTIVGISQNSFGNLEYEVKEEKTGIVVHYPESLLIPITIEKQKFKIGDTVRCITNINNKVKIIGIADNYYICENNFRIYFKFQEYWEKVEKINNKFDINTLIPFEDKVLVRNDENQRWLPAFWGYKVVDGFITTFGWCKYCIPYKGNEILFKTNNDCDYFYKTWEE